MAGAKCCVVFVTAPSLEVAKNIAKGEHGYAIISNL